MIIAVDGPSAAGKGTIAKAIATTMGYHFLDTGSLYRATAFLLLQRGGALEDEQTAGAVAATLDLSRVSDTDLRSEVVASAASRISAFPTVRSNLLDFQRRFAAQHPGAVLDGRDIGTVICPAADVKLYITASAEVRAKRRFDELLARGETVTFPTILADVQARDHRDATRSVSPLMPAVDAVVIDTSAMAIEEAIAMAMAVVQAKSPSGPAGHLSRKRVRR
jgi:CMP/dCMP kinase